MRVLFGIVLSGILWFGATPNANAAVGLSWGTMSLTSQLEQGKTLDSVLHINPEWDWGWGAVELVGNLDFTRQADKYSSYQLAVRFPELSHSLRVDFDNQWLKNYRVSMVGLGYQWIVFSDLKLKADYKAGKRNPVPDKIQYRYSIQRQDVALQYSLAGWGYALDFTRTDKEYPETSYYSSERLELRQKVSWQINSGYQVSLNYTEDTADYPHASFASRLVYDYWKETWGISGQGNATGDCPWEWDLKQLQWTRGLSLYRQDRHLDIKLNSSVKKKNGLLLAFGIADLYYYPAPNFIEPGEEDTETEVDFRSRFERKGMIGYVWREKQFSWRTSYYLRRKDYRSGVNQMDAGFSLDVQYDFLPFRAQLIFAPAGNIQHYGGYYQMELRYYPDRK